MNPISLVSSQGGAGWRYIKPEFGRTGRSLAENNFAKERRDWLPIFLRDVLQNALDARVSSQTQVRVVLSYRELDARGRKLADEIVDVEHRQRFVKSVPHRNDEAPSITDCLVVEDFGTTGLTGALDNPDLDGAAQNWNAFWFREGEGGKEGGSGNGGAGQGKITFFSASNVRTIFAYTVRNDDGLEVVFGASSFLRDYIYGPEERKWKRDAYWGLWQARGDQHLALPMREDETIGEFRECLGLTRKSGETGTSLIIPDPKMFDDNVAVQIVLAEFFVPILRGDLAVTIRDVVIDKSTVNALADARLSDERARELDTCTTKGFREFMALALENSTNRMHVVARKLKAASEIDEDCFEPDQLNSMRDALKSEQMISVRFATSVRPKIGEPLDCNVDVHIMLPFGLERPEQAVIRKDLLIGDEPIGQGKLRQRARGLTLIRENELSKLLLNAEEATHLRWNTRLPRLGEYYKNGPEVVSFVRNAMSKLLDVLLNGDQQRDFKLLAKYFSVAGHLPSNQAQGKRSPNGKQVPTNDAIPPPRPKLLAIDALEDGCRVHPARSAALAEARLPLAASVEFAYEGLDKDAFAEYDPMDFDVEDKSFQITATGCDVTKRSFNRIELNVTDRDFEFTISGFDKNLRLRMRLKYEEADDGTSLDAE